MRCVSDVSIRFEIYAVVATASRIYSRTYFVRHDICLQSEHMVQLFLLL